MNLTLKGSQISLNKSNSNSGRSSARTYNANYRTGNVTQNNGNHEVSSYDPEVLSNSSLPSVKQKLKLLNNLFNKDDNGIHIDLNEANSTNPIIIPQKNDGNSFSSNQNDSSVSDWLETHFLCQNNSNLKWGKIKADCVTRSETRNADLKAERNDNITDDSLDLEMGADFSNVAMDLKKITDEDSDIYCIDINEKTDTPPPCLVRPSSNSINTSRQISSPQDETDQTSGRLNNQNRRNSAATTIQNFWRRHRRRHLAAEAAMRRLLEDQKRRLNEENLNSRGQPIQSVLQNRQNELKQRRKKQHQNAIKVLHENRSINGLKRRDSIKDEQSVNTMIKSDTLTDKQEECKDINESNILKKPTSPIKLNQNKSWNPSDSFSENPQQNKCTTDESASVGNYSDNLIDSAKLQVEKHRDESDRRINVNEVNNRSTVDDILHELKQLEKVDDLTYHSICSQDVRTTTEKQIPLKKSSTPNTWSEMVKDINRVLSEAEQDELQLDCSRKYCDSSRSVVVDGIRSRSDSILSNHSSLLHSNSLGPPTTVTNNYSYLTKENLRSHTKQMEHVDFRQKAQKELDQSISQCREKLATFIKSNHSSVNHKLPESNIGNISTGQRAQSAKTQNSLTPSTKSLHSNLTNTRPVHSSHIKNSKTLSNTNLPYSSVVDSKTENKLFQKNNMIHNVRDLHHSISLLDDSKVPQCDDRNTIIDNQTLILELEEKEGQINRLQRIIEHQRELSLRQLQDTQRDGEQRAESLKADYECTINRNYNLIDELIEEKKVLHTKCEELLEELKAMTKKFEERIKTMEEKHKVELRKVEAKHAAAEKIRREKWEAEKVKHFKEVTIRGMENEVAQMIANHKAELAKLRQSCAEQIQAADVRAYQAYTSHIEELRKTLIKEKEEACSKEREVAEQRLNQTLTEERASLEANRRRLMSEISDERERLALIATKQREEMDTLRHNLESALAEANEQHKMEIQQLRADLSQRHKDEITELNQRNLAERAAWEDHTKSLLESQYTTRETVLREKLKKDRDRLLESAIHRLEAEANEARLETDRQTELKIKRVREKFQAEIEELERSEKQAMEKYCQMKTQFLDKEHEADRLRSQFTQKDQELAEVRVLYEKLNQERQNISDVIRQEFADRLVFVEEENRSVKRELAECKARIKAEQERHEKEIDAIKKSNNSEIETVHQKVKEVIKKKDEKLVMLRENFHSELEKKDRELEAVNQRAQHLEELIDQQRKQFLQSNH